MNINNILRYLHSYIILYEKKSVISIDDKVTATGNVTVVCYLVIMKKILNFSRMLVKIKM